MARAAVSAVILIAAVGCGRDKAGAPRGATPPPHDAAPLAPITDATSTAAAPAVRPDALVPVIALDGKPYLELDRWFDLEAPKAEVIAAWGDGPTAEVKLGPTATRTLALLRQPAPKAPAPWRATTGATVPAYTADGAACAATLGEPMLLGQGTTGTIDTTGYGDESRPRVVAALRTPGCAPVVATAGPAPRFYAIGAPSSAQRKALLAAWKRHPGRAEAGDLGVGAPALQLLTAAGAPPLALVTREHDASDEDECGSDYAALRALYALPPDGAPMLQASSTAVFLDAPLVAALARASTDAVVLIYGAYDLDFGMSGHRVAVAAVTLPATAPDSYEVGFTRYIGCD